MTSRGGPSQDDRELFRRSVGAVRVLDDDRARPARAPARRGPLPERARPGLETDPETRPAPAPDAGERQRFRRGGVPQRVLRQLERGRLPVEADLDLHGLTVADAEVALARFVDECQACGVRLARIIHGKGLGSPNARPVLKAEVDRWLRLRDEVLAFCSAQPRDGGTGALYVLLGRAGRG